MVLAKLVVNEVNTRFVGSLAGIIEPLPILVSLWFELTNISDVSMHEFGLKYIRHRCVGDVIHFLGFSHAGRGQFPMLCQPTWRSDRNSLPPFFSFQFPSWFFLMNNSSVTLGECQQVSVELALAWPWWPVWEQVQGHGEGRSRNAVNRITWMVESFIPGDHPSSNPNSAVH